MVEGGFLHMSARGYIIISKVNIYHNSKGNIPRINPYTYDTKVEDITPENICDNVNILSPII